MISKRDERQRLKETIKHLTQEYKQLAHQNIAQQVIKILENYPPQGIGIYLSRPDEVATDLIYDWLKAHRWTIYAPRVKNKNLEFYQINDKESDLVWNEQFKVWEPKNSNPPAKKFSIIITPLVGYGLNNHRLGRGQGYYDRWLHFSLPRLAMGLAYKEQAVDPKLAFNSADFPLNLIIRNQN